MAKRGTRTAADVRLFIDFLAAKGQTAADIERQLRSHFKDRLGDVPGRRTIERQLAEMADPSGPWRFADAASDEGALVLPVLVWLVEASEGKRSALTRGEGEWIARVKRIDPAMPDWYAFLMARSYLLAKLRDKDTRDLDVVLGLRLWTSGADMQRYRRLVEAEWIGDTADEIAMWKASQELDAERKKREVRSDKKK